MSVAHIDEIVSCIGRIGVIDRQDWRRPLRGWSNHNIWGASSLDEAWASVWLAPTLSRGSPDFPARQSPWASWLHCATVRSRPSLSNLSSLPLQMAVRILVGSLMLEL